MMRYLFSFVFKTMLLAFFVFSAFGCASGHRYHNTGYTEQQTTIKAMSEITMLVDVGITSDGPGSTEILYAEYNRSVADEVVNTVSSSLRQKGYVAHPRAISTVGAALNTNTKYEVVEEEGGGHVSRVPFFVDGSFSRNDGKRNSLLDVHKNLLAKGQGRIENVKDLGIDGDGLMVIQVGGFLESQEKQIAEGTAKILGAAAIGILSGTTPQVTISAGTSQVRMHLVDLKTGRVVWGHAVNEKGYPNTAGIRYWMPRYLDGLPVR